MSPGLGPLGRIIPARAGFTQNQHHAAQSTGDHPRSRGVYDRPVTLEKLSRGSSPLARGLQEQSTPAFTRPGIIPARAGFTLNEPYLLMMRPDHPRSRGVYDLGIHDVWEIVRIIPARAGFTR